jgi:hypothetical protein
MKRGMEMENKLVAPEKRKIDVSEIIDSMVEAARIRLMKLDAQKVQRLRERKGDVAYNVVELLGHLSTERQDILSFGPSELEQSCGLTFTSEQKEKMEMRPWGERTLDSPCPFNPGKMVRETSGMIAVPHNAPIMKLKEVYKKSGKPRFNQDGEESWYSREAFAWEATPSFGWHLVLLEISPHFPEKQMTHEEQVKMLPGGYAVASAALEVLKNLAVFELTGKYPNPNYYASTSDCIETSDVALGNKRVRVGSIPGKGVSVDFWWENIATDWRTGLAIERKPELPLPGNLAFQFLP